MNPPRYNIRDLEKLSGIKAHTIRIWEKRYSIIKPYRTDTNIRSYTDEDLQKIMNISLLNRNGFKISQISQMTELEMGNEVQIISDSPAGNDVQINNLIQAAEEFQEDGFETVLNTSIIKLGFEQAFIQIVFPFLEKLGLLWQIGKVNACQERFVKNLIRHKLVVAIDGLVGQSQPTVKKGNYLLYLPLDEYSELELLFLNYLLRKFGHHVVYLGPSIPLDHLQRLKDRDQYTGIVTAINYQITQKELRDYYLKLSSLFNEQPVYIFSRSVELKLMESSDKLLVISSFERFITLIG